MFPPFPQESARHYCTRLISLIEKGAVVLEQCGRESAERKDQGLMIGALVCWNKSKKQRTVLYAVSGNNKQLKLPDSSNNPFQENSVFVPSIASSEIIDKALEKNDLKIHQLTDQINKLTLVNKNLPERKQFIKERTALTDASLKKVFSLYSFTCFDGSVVSLDDIIQKHGGKLPPTGTGDCCAPKLLSYAFANKLEPVSMDEVYFGKDTAHKKNGVSYPPCDERCGYILPSILGLEILYCDKDILVINKESGLLSVPGKGEKNQDCVESRVRRFYPEAPKQCAVHRLDMETSGILVVALNAESHRKLNEQFAGGAVHKKYIALLDGVLRGKPEGRVELKARVDLENRPHQILDSENGKLGITEWKKLGVEKTADDKNCTRILFTPLTGRTHQLRIASATSVEQGGLGLPIIGDSLYGTNTSENERLMLHACEIEFTHPVSGEPMHIICPPSF